MNDDMPISEDGIDPWASRLIDLPTQQAIIKELGNLLRELRVASGLKMVELSDECGVSQSVLCRVELARRVPGVPLLMNVCAKLGVRVSDLFRAAEDAAVPLPVSAPRAGRFHELAATRASGTVARTGTNGE